MIYAEPKILDFIKTYRSVIINTKSETEYWKMLIWCLFKAKYLEQEDAELLVCFLMDDENKIFLEDESLTPYRKDATMVRLLEEMLEAERIFQNKEHADHKNSRFFADARKYYILYEMYQDKYYLLKGIIEAQVRYKRYGKSSVLHGGHHNYRPIADLMYSNVQMVGFFKERPEKLKDTVEYDYDKQGNLIIYKALREGKGVYDDEFGLMTGDWILNLCFSEDGILEGITLRTFEKDLIIKYEYVRMLYWLYPVWVSCRTVYQESYRYDEKEILAEATYDEYRFPESNPLSGEIHPGRLRRSEMKFESDEEECLKGYWVQDFDENGAKNQPGYCELSERKRKLTKKTRGRWRRPNYFVE